MTDPTVLKIAMAGLLHDVGKFAQGCLEITPQYRQDNEDIYQPKFDGHPSHVHALYTAAFLEQASSVFPKEASARQWGKGAVEDTLLNLAACHHAPRTAMQWIVTQADRISSGLDRATFEKGESIAFQDFKKTRLLPVLESLGPQRAKRFSKADEFHFRYPLSALSAQAIFPQEAQAIEKKQAEQEYQSLFNQFQEKLPDLAHREDIRLWAEHFDSLWVNYASTIPAARVGDVVHDVSLYDHSRSTAALAAALYRYHADTDALDETSIKKSDTEKFLLVSGDFYGIQDFIFSAGGETRKFRSKLLRGRSFAVSLFSELAADLVCRKLELPFLSVVMNAAGKFHLIAPNTTKAQQAIQNAEAMINDWLFEQTYGQSSLGLSATPASPDDFYAGGFADLWQRHLKNVEARKFRKVDLNRHGGSVEHYLDSFINDDSQVKHPLCPLCGKRPSTRAAENDGVFESSRKQESTSSCDLCRDHVFLGKNLVKNPLVAVYLENQSDLKPDNRLLSSIFSQYQVSFEEKLTEKQAQKGSLIKLWQVQGTVDGSIPASVTTRLINGHVPCYREADNQDTCLLESAKTEEKLLDFIEQIKEGVPKTFSHIAIKARHRNEHDKCLGVEALGVLKADVDNLGMLFGCGLPDKKFTLSRLATVSRQLNNFFVLYLPHLLATSEEFYDTYTVFAGGDDLFLIGPWNRMADLAEHLRKRFAEYVCNNPEITFSAGITVHKPHVPVDKMAEAAEEALAEAKRAGRNRITMFGETVTWETFKTLLQARTEMEQWLAHKYIGDAMFYRFNYLVAMAEMEKQIMENKTVELADMESLKWRALFKYSLARNINRKRDDWQQALAEMDIMALWLEQHRGAVRIPLWHVLYEKRR